MKLFLDIADTAVVAQNYGAGVVDVVTTNPTLIKKSGRDPHDVYKDLIKIGLTDISMEVIGSKENMVSEGKRLAKKFPKCATIKVPCTPDGLMACKELAENNIRVNVTLIFSPSQAILAAKAGAAYVSPFVGRVDDNSFGGLCLIKDIANVFEKQSWDSTQILAASIRGVRDVGRAFEYGADICTIPVKVFEGMYNHILTDKGLDIFDKDYAASIEGQAILNSP